MLDSSASPHAKLFLERKSNYTLHERRNSGNLRKLVKITAREREDSAFDGIIPKENSAAIRKKKNKKKEQKEEKKKKELAECTRRGRSYLHFSGKLRGITWKTNPPCSNVIRRRPRSSAECSGCDSHFSDRWRSPRRRKRRPWLPWWFRLPSSRCSYRNARLQKKNERKRTSG